MSLTTAIHRAVGKFDGSPTKVAAALSAAMGVEVKRQHVEHWLKSGRVPPENVPALAELTGIPMWDFRENDWYRIWPMLIGTPGAPDAPKVEAEPAAESGAVP